MYLLTFDVKNIALLQEGRVGDGSNFANAFRRQLVSNESGTPAGRFQLVLLEFGSDFEWKISPVSHSSELDSVACAVLRLDSLDPSLSRLLARMEVLVFPSLKVEVGVTQRGQRVFCHGILCPTPLTTPFQWRRG